MTAALLRCSRSPTRVPWCSAVKLCSTLSSRVVGRLPVTKSTPATAPTATAKDAIWRILRPSDVNGRSVTKTTRAASVPRAALREADAAIAQTVRYPEPMHSTVVAVLRAGARDREARQSTTRSGARYAAG